MRMDTDKKQLFSVFFEDGRADDELDHLNAVSEKIIGCAFKVGNTLGCGFSKKSMKTLSRMS